jgi:psp operon transcriptional activator
VPPLRAREDDILRLAEHFANNMTSTLGRDFFAGFTDAACEAMLHHRWPGNVRELKNVVERSVYRHERWQEPLDRVVFDPFESPWRPGPPAAGAGEPHGDGRVAVPSWPVDLKALLRERERQLLDAAMEAAQFNQRRAAELLGLSYHQLRAALRRQHD